MFFFFFKQKTAYEMRISDWSSDVCSSDLFERERVGEAGIIIVDAAHASCKALGDGMKDAHLIGPCLGDVLRPFVETAGDGTKQSCAFGMRHTRPWTTIERAASGRDRSVHVGFLRLRDAQVEFFRCRGDPLEDAVGRSGGHPS